MTTPFSYKIHKNPYDVNKMLDEAMSRKENVSKEKTLKMEKKSLWNHNFWYAEDKEKWETFNNIAPLTKHIGWEDKNWDYHVCYWEWNYADFLPKHIDDPAVGRGNLLIPIVGETTTYFYDIINSEDFVKPGESRPYKEKETNIDESIFHITYGPGEILEIENSTWYHSVHPLQDYRLQMQLRLQWK